MEIPTIRTAVAQIRPVPGDIRANLAHILDSIESARAQGAALVVLPELSTSGYLLGDRWEHDAFIAEIAAADETILAATKGIAVIWGSVTSDHTKVGEDGRQRLYNCARVAQDGEWVSNGLLSGFIPKTNLPKYRIFDDARHFYPADKLAAEMDCSLMELLRPFPLCFGDETFYVGVAICEDLWEDEYAAKPSRIYGAHDVSLLIDISSSPWTADKWKARERMLRRRVEDVSAPILYVNAVGLQNNVKNFVWFDGDSGLVNDFGQFLWRAPQHEEGLYLLDLSNLTEPLPERQSEGIKEIHAAIVHAMREAYAGIGRVIIGLSGGVDSAVSAALHVEALGPERVFAVNMPTQYNSQTTQDLARACAEALGVEYLVVPIQDLYGAHLRMLAGAGYAEPAMIVKENVQARIRGASVLAAIAAAENGVFTNNGNKTEVALNYFTLYGDGAGFGAWLGDLWKGQVYDLAWYMNRQAGHELIPKGIIDIIPSAELSADQNVDEGKGDPIFYPYHDRLLQAFTEWRWSPSDVMEYLCDGTLEKSLGCTPGTLSGFFPTRQALVANLEWAWNAYNREFKRAQVPPVFITSRRAFGFDRRDTIQNAYFTDQYAVLKERYLTGGTSIE